MPRIYNNNGRNIYPWQGTQGKVGGKVRTGVGNTAEKAGDEKCFSYDFPNSINCISPKQEENSAKMH